MSALCISRAAFPFAGVRECCSEELNCPKSAREISVTNNNGGVGGGGGSIVVMASTKGSLVSTFTLGDSSGDFLQLSRRRSCKGGQLERGRMSSHTRTWRMEVADPLNNSRDSFGNECMVEKRARKELERTDSYRFLKAEVQDLEEELQQLVAKEEYEQAAAVRDALHKVTFKKRIFEISAKPRVLYRVGEVIIHRRYGYRGVVYGHDPHCCAPTEWQEAMKVEMLPNGRKQPFYHVLVDTRDRPGGMSTYVAQENIALQKMPRPVLHPWIPKFFSGFEDGTYIPKAKLRSVYPNDW